MATPQQDFFLLNLENIDESQATLSTLDGTSVSILLSFGSRIAGRASAHGMPYLRIYQGESMTVKALGIAARRALGLQPRTPLHVTTRLLWGNEVLPMHRPLGTLLGEDAKAFRTAYENCYLCHSTLRQGARQEDRGPFLGCYFCNDSPSWHHGACCPHNTQSRFFQGKSHRERFEEVATLMADSSAT